MIEANDLSNGDLQILDAFQDSEANLAFQGLKRKLGIHQESLSRALRRLEDDELLVHTQSGYRLTRRGSELARKLGKDEPHPHKVLETYLPSNISASEVASRMKNTWFSNLRWLGYAETKEGTVLSWLAEDGNTQVTARFDGPHLVVEVKSEIEDKLDIGIRFAHELTARIIREYHQITQRQDAPLIQRAVPTTKLS